MTRAPTADALVRAIRAAAARGAQLVVLPELSSSGYCFRDAEEAGAAAEPIDGPTVTSVCRISRELSVTVVFGLALRENDALYNAAVLVESGVVLGLYRKSHLWSRERLLFTAGDDQPLVVSTRCGSLALLVCYDLEFPELVRVAAEAGADIVTVPVNWPLTDHPSDQLPVEVVKAQAAAAYYGVYIVVADRYGDERGTRWVGGSCVVAPTGYLIAGPATAPGEAASMCLLVTDIDLAAARDKTLGPHNHRLHDRRPSLYRPLVSRG